MQATAAAIAQATGAKVVPVRADVATPEGQAALFEACPEPDILVNNNAGPPLRDFRELTRQQLHPWFRNFPRKVLKTVGDLRQSLVQYFAVRRNRGDRLDCQVHQHQD